MKFIFLLNSHSVQKYAKLSVGFKTNKKIIKTPKFEAKEQFTNSALENLKSEKERLINNLIDSGEFKPNI